MCDDNEVVLRVLRYIKSVDGDATKRLNRIHAFDCMVSMGSGMDQTSSAVDDLRRKSGPNVDVVIDIAVEKFAASVCLGSVGRLMQEELMTDESLDNPDSESILRGVYWELSLSYCVILMSLFEDKVASYTPVSCFDPTARMRFIEQFLASHHCL